MPKFNVRHLVPQRKGIDGKKVINVQSNITKKG